MEAIVSVPLVSSRIGPAPAFGQTSRDHLGQGQGRTGRAPELTPGAAVGDGEPSPTLGPIVSAQPGATGDLPVRPPSPRTRSRSVSVPVVLVVLAALGVLAGACGSATVPSARGAGTASALAAAQASGSYRAPGSLGGGPVTSAGEVAARTASASYRDAVGNDAASFVADIGRLHADLVAGDAATARSDELDAQSAYDGFRLLESGNTIIGSTLDERSTDIGPGQSFGGLHAVERDLWDAPSGAGPSTALSDALADSSGLVAQAPVAQYLLSRDSLEPEAIGTTAVDELSWVDDVAVPGNEELYSHLDAVDIAATVGAAQAAFTAVRPLAHLISPALTGTTASSFATLGADVAALGPPDQTPDATIPPASLRTLAQQVDATAALLARLSALLAPYGTAGATS